MTRMKAEEGMRAVWGRGRGAPADGGGPAVTPHHTTTQRETQTERRALKPHSLEGRKRVEDAQPRGFDLRRREEATTSRPLSREGAKERSVR